MTQIMPRSLLVVSLFMVQSLKYKCHMIACVGDGMSGAQSMLLFSPSTALLKFLLMMFL